jgi:hypothetical protein
VFACFDSGGLKAPEKTVGLMDSGGQVSVRLEIPRMNALKIAASDGVLDCFQTAREVVPFKQTDYTDVAVAVFSVADVMAGALEALQRTGFSIPIFLVTAPGTGTRARDVYKHLEDVLLQVNGIFDPSSSSKRRRKPTSKPCCHPSSARSSTTPKRPTPRSPAPVTRAVSFSVNTRRAGSSSTSSAKRCFAPTCATPTSNSATC